MATIRTITKTIRRKPLRIKTRTGFKTIPQSPIRVKTTIRTR